MIMLRSWVDKARESAHWLCLLLLFHLLSLGSSDRSHNAFNATMQLRFFALSRQSATTITGDCACYYTLRIFRIFMLLHLIDKGSFRGAHILGNMSFYPKALECLRPLSLWSQALVLW